jgi:hypothetical protein
VTVPEQREGCSSHLFIPELIDGEVVDASEVEETVTYRLRDGSIWVNGNKGGTKADA